MSSIVIITSCLVPLMLVAALIGLILFIVRKNKDVDDSNLVSQDSEVKINEENLIVEDGDNNDLS